MPLLTIRSSEVRRLYSLLHELGVCHNDLSEDHILEAYPPWSAYNDPHEANRAREERSADPTRIEYRIVDLDTAYVASDEDMEAEFKRLCNLFF